MKYLLEANRTYGVLFSCLVLLLQSCVLPVNDDTLSIAANPETACNGSLVEVTWTNSSSSDATLSASSLTEPPFAGEVSGDGNREVSVDETTIFTIDTRSNPAASTTTDIVASGTIIPRTYTFPWEGCSLPLNEQHGEVIDNTLSDDIRITSVVNNTNRRISLTHGGQTVGIDPSEATSEFNGLPAGGEWKATHSIDQIFSTTEGCNAPGTVVLASFPVDIEISVTAACP